MTYNDIYLTALTYLGEVSSSSAVSDYSDRAEYLMCGVVSELMNISEAIGTKAELPSGKITKTAEFPLDTRLAPAAALLLASGLTAHEHTELSDKLRENADTQLSSIAFADIHPILEVYD